MHTEMEQQMAHEMHTQNAVYDTKKKLPKNIELKISLLAVKIKK